MESNLVIVESPAKAKTIEKFLGKDYLVKSSFGHIRDLSKKNLGIDIKHGFKPEYIISTDKKKIVSELLSLSKKVKTIWIATDEDREGEAIAWHLFEALKLKGKDVKRIVFHEITKNAILQAIKTPRDINQNLVNSQQARRVLDRLVGFELSPVLWKKVQAKLSAGRVQSVTVRLLVEREREIMAFESQPYYRVSALFSFNNGNGNGTGTFEAVLNDKFNSSDEAKKFLETCTDAVFSVKDINIRPAKKSPSPPFTTSTLQQEASRRLGLSVAQTMHIAQKLYEEGKITYMRTDSVNLSQFAIEKAKEYITDTFGKEYSNPKQFATKSKGAQEAHEAIRPSYLDKPAVHGNINEKKLYDLIWKRTVASQMADANIEKTTVVINNSNSEKTFIANGEVIKFDGFLKLYQESKEDDNNDENGEGILPLFAINQQLVFSEITAQQKYTQSPPRYSEATLVKKLEELGIGRPSTYAPTISTIQQRGYVMKDSKKGEDRELLVIKLTKDGIAEGTKKEKKGTEKNKLIPKNMGMIVTDFLVEKFDKILDYNFTASVEKKFDIIAEGSSSWEDMIEEFYKDFHQMVETAEKTTVKNVSERELGTDPESGKPVTAKMGRYGPIVQMGENNKDNKDEKPRYASMLKGQFIETITLEEALSLFQFPRVLGEYEGETITASFGKYGPYVKLGNSFIAMKKNIDDPFTIDLNRAIELINEKKEQNKNRIIKTFANGELQVLNGRWGPYISFEKKNYRIPKKISPDTLTEDECMEMINKANKE